MDLTLRLGQRALFLLNCLTRCLYPLALLVFLVCQSSCETQILSRWRRSDQPRRTDQGQIAAEPQNSSAGKTKEPFKSAKVAPQAAKVPLFPESVLAPPDVDAASLKLKYDTVVFGRTSVPPVFSDWQYRMNRENRIVGFEFSNRGGNRILPERYDIGKNLLFTRDFQFRFDDRARQDIHLAITDWAPSADRQFRLSGLMNSALYFFPRHFLPAIASLNGHYVVTLPTGEQTEFDALTHEILNGVLSETPVDLTPNRAARKFPGISYSGKGVLVRVNARGADPRIGTTATITTGSPQAECKGKNCDQCQVPARELWSQTGAVRFKFPTDPEFDRYLRSRCGFGLPFIEPKVVVAATTNG